MSETGCGLIGLLMPHFGGLVAVVVQSALTTKIHRELTALGQNRPNRHGSRATLPLSQRLKLTRLAAAALVLVGAVVVVSSGAIAGVAIPNTLVAHAILFYAITLVAYLTLPFTRRGDIAMVAMWLVLAVGIAPCFRGHELSAPEMFADMGGVFLAAAPIYVARFRQLAQGDTRALRRRQAEAGVSDRSPVQTDTVAS
jgi:hypothetical protein